MMKPILTIDQGNTRTKCAVILNGVVTDESVTPSPSLDNILSLIERHNPEGAIYCSVGRIDIRFIESLRHLIPGPVEVLTHSTPLPIQIEYKTPDTLGLDRIVAAVGTRAILGPGKAALIVDAGTCITLDLLSADGRFLGGNISAGILMRFKALHQFTGALPLVAANGDSPVFGYDTPTAIRAGVLQGVKAEIIATFHEAHRLYNITDIVLSGGDISTITPLLDNSDHNAYQLHVCPNLLAAGLEKIFRYNEI